LQIKKSSQPLTGGSQRDVFAQPKPTPDGWQPVHAGSALPLKGSGIAWTGNLAALPDAAASNANGASAGDCRLLQGNRAVKPLIELRRLVVRKIEWRDVGYQRRPMDQIRRRLHYIFRTRRPRHVEAVLPLGVGHLVQCGRRSRRSSRDNAG